MRSQEKRTVIIDLLLKETNNTAAEILNAQGNRNPIKETSKRGGINERKEEKRELRMKNTDQKRREI